MLRVLNGILDRIFVLAGALLFAQVPIYIQFYTQRLAGHTAELSYQVEHLRKIALISGKTLDQYIHKFAISSDSDFKLQGEWMLQLLNRYRDLKHASIALQEASPFSRPFHFFQYFNIEIAKPTFDTFEPGLSLNFESGVYALIGALFGYAVFLSLKKIVKFLSLKKVDPVISDR